MAMSEVDRIEYPTPKTSDGWKKSKKREREEAVDGSPTKKIKKSKKESRNSRNKPSEHSEDTHRQDSASEIQSGSLRPSPFCRERVSLCITLSPITYGSPLKGAVAEHLSPLLLTYYPPLDGVVLAFENSALSNRPETKAKALDNPAALLGQSIDEYAVTYIWLSADFLVLRPLAGTVMEGVVNVQNQSMLGLLCYNYFNASIASTDLPKDFKWTRGQDKTSCYVDGSGSPIQGRIAFTVKDFEATISDAGTGAITIFGTMQE